MKRILAIIVLLMMDFPLRAQDTKTVDLEGSLNLSAGTDSRSVVGSGNFTDGLYLFSPSLLAVRKFSPRTQFSAMYAPEFELFGENRELNAWNHSARLGATLKFSPRFSFDMGDSFLSTIDPSRQLANSFLLLPPSRYQENALYVLGDYSLSPRTMLSFRFDNTVIRYGLAAEYRKNFQDQMGNAWTATLAWKLKPREKITASYTLLHLTVLDSPGLPSSAGSGIPAATHYFTVGYLNTMRPDLTFGVTAGLISAADFSYALSGQIQKRVGTVWLDAEYSRTISFFGSQAFGAPGSPQLGGGLLASNRYELVSIGASGDLGRRVGLVLRVTWSRTGSELDGLTSRSLFGTLRFNYRINEHMTLYTAADLYSQDLNEFPGTPTSRHRFYGGLELSLSRRHLASGAHTQALPAAVPTPTGGDKEK
jgi:hypothetical protein